MTQKMAATKIKSFRMARHLKKVVANFLEDEIVVQWSAFFTIEFEIKSKYRYV